VLPDLQIYVAGPLGDECDWERNVGNALCWAEQLAEIPRVLPHVPHLKTLWHGVYRHGVEHWMRMCLAEVQRSDGLFRVVGKSPNADREVAFAKVIGLPVFNTLAEVEIWAASAQPRIRGAA